MTGASGRKRPRPLCTGKRGSTGAPRARWGTSAPRCTSPPVRHRRRPAAGGHGAGAGHGLGRPGRRGSGARRAADRSAGRAAGRIPGPRPHRTGVRRGDRPAPAGSGPGRRVARRTPAGSTGTAVRQRMAGQRAHGCRRGRRGRGTPLRARARDRRHRAARRPGDRGGRPLAEPLVAADPARRARGDRPSPRRGLGTSGRLAGRRSRGGGGLRPCTGVEAAVRHAHRVPGRP